MFILNDDIQENLDAELRRLLEGVLRQRDMVDLTPSFGVGKPYLVYFVLGIIYTNLQIHFVDLYKSKGMAQEKILRDDFHAYWKKNVESVIKKLEETYGL